MHRTSTKRVLSVSDVRTGLVDEKKRDVSLPSTASPLMVDVNGNMLWQRTVVDVILSLSLIQVQSINICICHEVCVHGL